MSISCGSSVYCAGQGLPVSRSHKYFRYSAGGVAFLFQEAPALFFFRCLSLGCVRYQVLAINFDLRQNALDRHPAPEFDKDWLLLTRVLRQIGYIAPQPSLSIAACSSDEVQSTGMLAMAERRKATSFSSGLGREIKAAFQGTLR